MLVELPGFEPGAKITLRKRWIERAKRREMTYGYEKGDGGINMAPAAQKRH
jgi:hypothetical protein